MKTKLPKTDRYWNYTIFRELMDLLGWDGGTAHQVIRQFKPSEAKNGCRAWMFGEYRLVVNPQGVGYYIKSKDSGLGGKYFVCEFLSSQLSDWLIYNTN